MDIWLPRNALTEKKITPFWPTYVTFMTYVASSITNAKVTQYSKISRYIVGRYILTNFYTTMVGGQGSTHEQKT